MRLTLASKSAARTAVLRGAGVAFETTGSDVDEDAVKTSLLAQGVGPKAVAEALADAKALAVSQAREGLVIGSDQTLDLQGRLFDKVSTLEAARERLRLLRGKPHQLHSSVSLAEGGQVVWRETVSAALTMRDFSDAFLEGYLAEEGSEALGSVGCYRLEGPGLQLFAEVQGDYFTILGLPMMGLLEALRGRGVLAT
ncbi:MAG: Maf family protein [Phenylobacterium sp.]